MESGNSTPMDLELNVSTHALFDPLCSIGELFDGAFTSVRGYYGDRQVANLPLIFLQFRAAFHPFSALTQQFADCHFLPVKSHISPQFFPLCSQWPC